MNGCIRLELGSYLKPAPCTLQRKNSLYPQARPLRGQAGGTPIWIANWLFGLVA